MTEDNRCLKGTVWYHTVPVGMIPFMKRLEDVKRMNQTPYLRPVTSRLGYMRCSRKRLLVLLFLNISSIRISTKGRVDFRRR